jgi:hypothetical protein
MMSARSNIFAAIAAGAVLGVVSQASAITYDVNLTVGDAIATGFFSGIVGNTSADVGAPFNLTLTEGLTSVTLVGSETGNNSEVVASPPLGNAITATNNQVLFNFSDSAQDFLKFSDSTGTTFLCFQTYAACGGTGPGIVLDVAGDPFQSETGNQVIASAVPGPMAGAGLPGLILGFAGLGFMAYRRKLKPILMAA